MAHFYKAFGLILESPLICPEMLVDASGAAPHVRIQFGPVPEALDSPADVGALWQAAPGMYLLKLEGLGRFLVRAGAEIVIQPVEPVAEDSLRAILLGTCLSILLHQRRMFALHVSGIHTSRGAVLFAGHSGAGKSTLASAFVQRGYTMLSDDMLAITLDQDDNPRVLPGFPQVKLWADSAEALGRSTEGLRRVLPDYDKFVAPIPDHFDPRPTGLHAIYFLRQNASPAAQLRPLSPTERFNGLLEGTWQKLPLAGLGLREWNFTTAARIAAHAYMARLSRPAGPFRLQELADLIEADFQRELQPTR